MPNRQRRQVPLPVPGSDIRVNNGLETVVGINGCPIIDTNAGGYLKVTSDGTGIETAGPTDVLLDGDVVGALGSNQVLRLQSNSLGPLDTNAWDLLAGDTNAIISRPFVDGPLVSDTNAGLCPELPMDTNKFLSGDGTWKTSGAPDLSGYAKLDCTNQPFTGDVQVNGNELVKGDLNLGGGTNKARISRALYANDLNVYNKVLVQPSIASATGGTITTVGGRTIHTFNANDNFVVSGGTLTGVEVLVVAGGGGGTTGAGGGAGGMIDTTPTGTILTGTYPVVVGTGGDGNYIGGPNSWKGYDGNNSVFNGTTAIGGGGGQGVNYLTPGDTGGSGGGGSATSIGQSYGGLGTAGQGNAGGGNGGHFVPDYPSGGGGGAGGVGFDSPTDNLGGAGGSGLQSSASGAAVYYAGGGGGGCYSTTGAGGVGGVGGGGNAEVVTNGQDGTNGLCGGGGGVSSAGGHGGKGGDGVVVISYTTPGGSPTVEEANIIISADSATGGEYGVNTFGDPSGRTVLTGDTVRFKTVGAEVAKVDETGNLSIETVGSGLRVAEGSNAKQGIATLIAGVATVSNTSVTANSRIFLTPQDNNTFGALRVSARTPGVSFTITSSIGTDTGDVAYEIFEPA